MGTTRERIRTWLIKGKEQGATHVVVVCDTFDHSDYPIYVMLDQKVREVVESNDGTNMKKVMEVYNLEMDIEDQLDEHRALNY